jgi:UDP-GlcNAc:undecaprenyl-phosphate GlcNAc-1-phosphate transferase
VFNISFITLISLGALSSSILSFKLFAKWFRGGGAAQDIHTQTVSRLGGLAIVISILLGIYTYIGLDFEDVGQRIFLVSVIGFFVGLSDDLRGFVPQSTRLAGLALVGVLYVIFIGEVEHIDLISDRLGFLWPCASFLITILTLVGVPNAFNLVDGLNGLASGFSLVVLCALQYVAESEGYTHLNWIIYFAMSAILGFMILNFPKGKIFLGDGGAYFLGLMIAGLCLYLNSVLRDVSSWFYLLLCIYPCCETLWTMVRRRRAMLTPDDRHLHQLVYVFLRRKCGAGHLSRWVINSCASIICLLFSLISVVPAIKFCTDTKMLVIFCLSFVVIYGFAYRLLAIRFEDTRDILRPL